MARAFGIYWDLLILFTRKNSRPAPAVPRVSVLLPSYKPSQKYALECLAGLEAQTYRDFEVVIVDESDSATTDWLRSQKTYFPMRVVRPNERLGLAKSLNLGIGECHGEFIARHDMDDICMPDRLEKQVAFLDKNPQVAAVGSWSVMIDADGVRAGLRKYPTTPRAVRLQAGLWNPFPHPGLMLRRSFFDCYGVYDADCYNEDYELWLRAMSRGAVMLNLEQPLIYYRLESNDRVRPRIWIETAKLRWRYLTWRNFPTHMLGIAMARIAAILPGKLFRYAQRLVNRFR
jgi:glycosyltransferase involved in cell wall biosynthesis